MTDNVTPIDSAVRSREPESGDSDESKPHVPNQQAERPAAQQVRARRRKPLRERPEKNADRGKANRTPTAAAEHIEPPSRRSATGPRRLQPMPAQPGDEAATPSRARDELPVTREPVEPVELPATRTPSPIKSKPASLARRRSLFGTLSFLLLFVLPTLLVGYYYAAVASDQYRVEVQFAVRGAEAASPFGNLGFAIPGTSTEQGDSYIVSDYVRSRQIIEDIRRIDGVDLRQFFAREAADFVYRIDPDMPLAEFTEYWRDRTDAEFNSITGTTTFEVYAFAPEDSRRIAELVLARSQVLVNELSRESRESLIQTAREEVELKETDLRAASQALNQFRNRNRITTATDEAARENTILQTLEAQLTEAQTKRRAQRNSGLSENSPPVRITDREIAALQASIAAQRSQIGSGTPEETTANVADLLSQNTELALAEEFARTNYTTALASLETALTDARKQQRYLATFVAPTAPDAALHPKRVLYPIIAAFWFLVLWAIVLFLYRSVRDHAV